MRVLITDSPVLNDRKKSGVGHYAQELMGALRRVAGEDAVHAWYPGKWAIRRQNWLDAQSLRYEALAKRPGTLAWAEKKVRGKFLSVIRSAFPSFRNPYQASIRDSGCAVYHEPNFIPLDLGLPTVVSVHDLSVVLYPQWHPPERVAVFEKAFHRGLTCATRLIAISEFGKQQIAKHLGWPPEKVSVTLMGVRRGLRPVTGDELNLGLRELRLAPGYLLHVGTLEPRKNLLLLLKAYCSLPGSVREKHPLVLAGGPGWNSEEIHSFLDGEGKDKNVRWLGYVKEEYFSALYSAARALVFPTFYEGFGMPTIEMMACGGAVLASTAGAVAETVGGTAHLTDPHDQDGWRDAMLRVCIDNDWWQSLRENAEETVRPFTWERCARDTLAAYQLALGAGHRENQPVQSLRLAA